jgi:hypothetical protein
MKKWVSIAECHLLSKRKLPALPLKYKEQVLAPNNIINPFKNKGQLRRTEGFFIEYALINTCAK